MTVADAVGEMREAERIKVEQARAEEEAEAGHAFAAAADSSASAPSPLLARYNELLHLLLSLLLRCGRIYHGIVLDFNLLQDQLLPFFGSLDESSSAGSRLQPGPFWSLAPEQQHVASQLLYYFDALSPSLLQLLLECMRHTALPLPSKLLLLNLIEDKFHQSNAMSAESDEFNTPAPSAPRWSVGSYVSFILGLIRPSAAVPAGEPNALSAQVSPLMEVACKMLRSISETEIDAALRDTLPPIAAAAAPMPVARGARVVLPPTTQSEVMIAPSSPAVLLELLAPMLSSTLQATLASSSSSAAASSSSAAAAAAPPKLDLLSALIVLDSLLEHAGHSAALPSPLASLLPAACYFLLCRSLTGSMVEGGLVRASAGWTAAPLVGFVKSGQSWMVALRLLYATATRGSLARMLESMSSAFTARAQDTQSQSRAVVVLVALTKCAGLREMLQQPAHQAAVLALAASMQRHTGIASQTLMAALHSELTMLFGQQASLL